MTLPEQVGNLRRALRRQISAGLKGRTERTIVQLLALKAIARREVDTQSQLAERLLIDAPAASRAVAKLEDEGLVRRSEGEDRRTLRLEVTPAGQKELKVFLEACGSVDQRVREHLSAREYTEVMRLMARMTEAMEPGAELQK